MQIPFKITDSSKSVVRVHVAAALFHDDFAEVAALLATLVANGLQQHLPAENQFTQKIATRQTGLAIGPTNLRRIDPREPNFIAAHGDLEAEIDGRSTGVTIVYYRNGGPVVVQLCRG